MMCAVRFLLLSACVMQCATALNFLVTGDWGGAETFPFTTPAEVGSATAMGAVASAYNSQFTLVLGDNFYTHGINTDCHDARFKNTFEDVFTAPSLQGENTWKVIAGNHDHLGNITAQLAYSAVSPRWFFPSLYWTSTEKIDNGSTIQFVMIDTVELCGNSDVFDAELEKITATLDGDELPGPLDSRKSEQQWAWIETQLSQSTADYLVVAGHYPVYSVCEHGPTSCLVDRLLPMLKKYDVTAYFAGHDHCAEYIQDPSDTTGVQHHGVGGTHLCDETVDHVEQVPKHSLLFHWDGSKPSGAQHVTSGCVQWKGAFAVFNVTATSFVGAHINSDGEIMYTAPQKGPRKVIAEPQILEL